MASRQFRIDLTTSAHLVVEFTTVAGEVVAFVVRLMLNPENGDACVARYDTAHGCPHLDIVNPDGRLIEKQFLFGISFSEAMCYAIHDFKKNHETYIREFEARSAKKD